MLTFVVAIVCLLLAGPSGRAEPSLDGALHNGRELFERETFGGNGRTCATCRSAMTLEDVISHHARFFEIVTAPRAAGDPPPVIPTDQDDADVVVFMELT